MRSRSASTSSGESRSSSSSSSSSPARRFALRRGRLLLVALLFLLLFFLLYGVVVVFELVEDFLFLEVLGVGAFLQCGVVLGLLLVLGLGSIFDVLVVSHVVLSHPVRRRGADYLAVYTAGA